MDLVGWIATAVFTASYFFRRADHMRRVQVLAACLWIAYGLQSGAVPVVAANALVVFAALFAGRTNAGDLAPGAPVAGRVAPGAAVSGDPARG
jgi:hypothetical protein